MQKKQQKNKNPLKDKIKEQRKKLKNSKEKDLKKEKEFTKIEKSKVSDKEKISKASKLFNKLDGTDVFKLTTATGEIIDIISTKKEKEEDEAIKKEKEEESQFLKITIEVIQEEIENTSDEAEKLALQQELKQKITEYLKLKNLAENLYNKETKTFNWDKFWNVIKVLGKDVIPILIKIFTKKK